ncbi:MAG TPA: T9SS type A sorting domain-containing protein [Flavipsychrobacter sp.]|nr:T9SS type A sorting domain-containing protein [Flavipsychrobacter sp.]
MKHLLIAILLTVASLQTNAQGTPQYVFDTTNLSIGYSFNPFDFQENVWENIYYKNDFPAMPAQGFITDVYIKTWTTTPVYSQLNGLKIKMGITNMKTYPYSYSTSQFLTQDSLLTTVFYDSVYTLPVLLQPGDWWHLSLPQPYPYSMLPLPGDVPQNLIVQFSKADYNNAAPNFRFGSVGTYFNDTTKKRGILVTKDNTNNQYSIPRIVIAVMYIGFNGYATSVNYPDRITQISVFPNPAQQRLFVSSRLTGAYAIYDITGKLMLKGDSISKDGINVHQLPAGMYLLTIGESTARFMKE